MEVAIDGLCEKCGGVMELRRAGSTQGLYCTQCDWAVVTTLFEEIRRDKKQYEVRITQGDVHNNEQVRAVASVAGVNFLAAIKILGESGSLVYTGRAVNVLQVKKGLESVGLRCVVSPDFVYS